VRVECWRWSDRSVEDARDRARRAADAVARRLAAGGGRLERYADGERPLREPVLEEHRGRDGAWRRAPR
jgi:hypothetical protein